MCDDDSCFHRWIQRGKKFKKPSSRLVDIKRKTNKSSLKHPEKSRSFSAPEVNASTLNQTMELVKASEEKKSTSCFFSFKLKYFISISRHFAEM